MSLAKRVSKKFTYSPELAMPQIPFVEDVLYVMRITVQPRYFQMATRDSPTYIANLGLIITEAAEEFRRVRSNGDESLEAELARLIVLMCSEEASCLFVDAYVEAGVKAGLVTLNLKGKTPREINKMCKCRRCNSPFRDILMR